jgi:hypothetical protein
MYYPKWRKVAAAACGVIVSVMLASPAQAASFSITSAKVLSPPGFVIAKIFYPGLGPHNNEKVKVGRAQLDGTDQGGNSVSIAAYCVDIFDHLQPGTFSTADLAAAPFDAARLADATTFLAHADGLVIDANSSAAAQLGLWEILYEGTGTAWNVSSGTFRSDIGLSASTLANGWLTALANHNWQPDPTISLELLVPQQGNQLQVRLVAGTPSALPGVPEPGSWAMMLSGFGLIGGTLRAQRHRGNEGRATA